MSDSSPSEHPPERPRPARLNALAGGAVCLLLGIVGLLLLLFAVRMGLRAENRGLALVVVLALIPGGLMMIIGGIVGTTSALREVFRKGG